MMKTDHEYMAYAIRLAEQGRYTTSPNPCVGCVVVLGGAIVGEGWHQQAGGPHAEVFALRQAGEQAKGATAYVTLEPCSHYGRTPPCCEALAEAGVTRVVIAMQDPNPTVSGRGIAYLQSQGIAVDVGVCQAQAEALNPGFIMRMQSARPWVRVKMAMSLDGRTAMASGESQWITGPAARQDVQRMRAGACVVLSGVGTVLADDPSLNVRLSSDALGQSLPVRQPRRVIIDAKQQVPDTAKLFHLPGEVTVYSLSPDEAVHVIEREHDTCVQLPGNDHVSLSALLTDLSARYEVNEVHVEAGQVLCGALLNEGLVDELVVYMAPHVMGDAARGLFVLPGLTRMSQRKSFTFSDIRHVGSDVRMTLKPSTEH